jgi:succinate dehydrogenase/fumarate reductase-like Fe-S protein
MDSYVNTISKQQQIQLEKLRDLERLRDLAVEMKKLAKQVGCDLPQVPPKPRRD